MRRIAAVLGVVAATVVLFAPAARAEREVTGGPYEGTKLTTPLEWTANASVPITAEIVVNGGVNLEVRLQFNPIRTLPDGCVVDAPTRAQPSSLGGNRYQVSVTATATCNGPYQVIVKPQRCQPILGCDTGVVLEDTIQVSVRPPDITGVSGAQGEDGAVTIKWSKVSPQAPDFTGYTVQRRDGGNWQTIAAVSDPSKTSAVDKEPPAGVDSALYRVYGRRSTNIPGEIGSAKPTEVTVPLRNDGTTTTLPPDGTDGGATTTVPPGTDGGTPATDGGGGGGGGSKSGGGGSGSGPRGRTGVGTRAPRLGTPSDADFPPLLADGEEEDGGFSEELPFDQGLPGDEDDFASLVYEDESGRGMAVPVATGFVLAAWAFHLRFLARASRPTR